MLNIFKPQLLYLHTTLKYKFIILHTCIAYNIIFEIINFCLFFFSENAAWSRKLSQTLKFTTIVWLFIVISH